MKKYPVIYKDKQGELVLNVGWDERNDDWVKAVEKAAGNPEQKAYEELKKKYQKGK
jgi:hypothetical protein